MSSATKPRWVGLSWREVVARPIPSQRNRVLIGVGSASATLVAGVLDYLTGAKLTFGVFYVIPVIIGTTSLGRRVGLALAAQGALVWVFADATIQRSGAEIPIHIANVLLRFATLAIIVALVTGFREALDSARRSERQSQEFLAFAAHQLRTPVAGLRATAEAVLARGGTPEQERLLTNLAVESGRAGQLVASLLRIARLDLGESSPQRATDLAALCRSEAERAQGRAQSLLVRFRTDGDAASFVVDPDATREALANLLDNALRHAVRHVDVSASFDADAATVAVSDDGPGLPPGTEEQAFERFVSLDGFGGAGLGLAITRALVASQGGAVRYQAGRFEIILPRRPRADTPQGASPHATR